MNPCLILTRNNLELTKKCVESVRGQDIQTYVSIWDNGSTDGTVEWLESQDGVWHFEAESNQGVSFGWNKGLTAWFKQSWEHILVLNNDTILPTWFYRHLLAYDFPFVTGVSVNQMSQIEKEPELGLVPSAHPDFSAFLIHRECWDKVGPFDENMKHYASDMDYHARGHQEGIKMMNSGVPFYHERSSTIKNATQEDRQEIESQANKDRAAFRAKWGVECNSPDYQELFK